MRRANSMTQAMQSDVDRDWTMLMAREVWLSEYLSGH